MKSELCKTCIHTKVCMNDKNLVGDVFVMGHPMFFDNDKLYEKYKERERQGFPCEDYMPSARWIPVTESLPEEGEMVLFTEGDEYPYTVIVGCIERGKWEYRDDMSTAIKPKPIAWMPLPDPYEEI